MEIRKIIISEKNNCYIGDKLVQKKNIEAIINNIFTSYGYTAISSPIIENLYEKVKGEYTLNFHGVNLNNLSLRSDMTSSIACIVANNYDENKIPYRLSYIENVFKYTDNCKVDDIEFTQAGVELIGNMDVDSEAEVIAVAINSLLESGLDDFKINLGHSKFLHSILNNLNLSNEKRLNLEKFISSRNFSQIEKFILDEKILNGEKDILMNLPKLTGDKNVLLTVKKMIATTDTLEAIIRLEDLFNIIEEYGLSEYISFDLSMIGNFKDYCGIIFEGYSKFTSRLLINGGRYENKVEESDVSLSAVGFSINVDELMTSLGKHNNFIIDKSKVTLIMYDECSREIAIKTAENFRSTGLIVEMSLFKSNIDASMNYAKYNNFGGILHFKDDNKIDIINVKDGDVKNVTLEELLGAI